jgi:integrase
MAAVQGVLGAGRSVDHAWQARTEEWLAQVGLRSRGVALKEGGNETTRGYGAVLTRFRSWCQSTGRDRHAGGMFGLQESDILAFVNRPRNTATGKAKPNTVRMELTVLSGFYGWVEGKYQAPNPMGTVRAPSVGMVEARPLDSRDCERALKNCYRRPWRVPSCCCMTWDCAVSRSVISAGTSTSNSGQTRASGFGRLVNEEPHDDACQPPLPDGLRPRHHLPFSIMGNLTR